MNHGVVNVERRLDYRSRRCNVWSGGRAGGIGTVRTAVSLKSAQPPSCSLTYVTLGEANAPKGMPLCVALELQTSAEKRPRDASRRGESTGGSGGGECFHRSYKVAV